MDWVLKVIDWCIYLLIGFSVFGFIYGTYEVIDLLFIRGKLW